MPDDEYPAGIAGAAELVEWFGRWPSFHDAEIVSLELNRLVHCHATSEPIGRLVSTLLTNVNYISAFRTKSIKPHHL